MIQSPDCCFYEKECGLNQRRNTDRHFRSSSSNTDEVKRREKKESPMNSFKEKKRQGHLTTKWLKQNYCASPDVCLPREIVYEQYIEFCKRERIPPACKATFGKLIRNAFPEISSKRLGARGHSKYHYNGIGIKQNSQFRNSFSSPEGITRFSAAGWDTEVNPKKFSLSSKVGTLLPNFPEPENLLISEPADRTKMATFILMYKTHCQCIADVVISGNFEEIRLFLLHFWQGFPEHLMPLTSLDVFLQVIAFCDCIMYRSLLDILIPSINFEMPERLLRSIQNTSNHWCLWVQSSLENMPEKILQAKMGPAKRFCRCLKRCVAFIHLLQVSRPILVSDAPQLLSEELDELLPNIISYNCISNAQCTEEPESINDSSIKQVKELQSILKKCSTTTLLIDTLDKMMLGIKGWKEDKTASRNFVFNWVYMLSKISFMLTEVQSRHFTTFHLLSSLIQEYILFAAESQQDKEEEMYIQNRFKKHLKDTATSISSGFDTAANSSCFLVSETKRVDSNNLPRQKSKRSTQNALLVESKSISYFNNTEIYPRTYAPYSETLPYNEMPSCRYAASTYNNSAFYNSNLNPCAVRAADFQTIATPSAPGPLRSYSTKYC